MTSYLRSSKYREEWADLAEGASDAGRVDLRDLLRIGDTDALEQAIAESIRRKPPHHDFAIAPGETRGVARHMSVTGG